MNQFFPSPFSLSLTVLSPQMMVKPIKRKVDAYICEDEVGILVVDMSRRIVSLNQKFIDLWGLTPHLINTRNDEQSLEVVSSKFEDPKSFLNEVREIYRQTGLEVHDLITLRNNRIFERYTTPQWLNRKIVGRLWSFREVPDSIGLKALGIWEGDDAPRIEHSFV